MIESPSRIAYATNLTYKQTVGYLDGMIEERLLILTDSKPFPYYEITPKGRYYLKVFAEIEDDLRPVKGLHMSVFDA
jgi:predicted transcriptional regulator